MTPGWGSAEPPPEPWSSGRWALSRRGDELADIAFDGRPVLRAVRAVVRDRDWRTVPPSVLSVAEVDGLRVGLRFAGLGAELVGDLTVAAEGDRLAVALVLRSGTAFARNRIGLVVLHAAEVAGEELEVEHTNGSRSATRFPLGISPHQPAMDVRALGWRHRGVRSHLAFEGDVFEMEDQRNWTDASFKTYSTPLREPMPVTVEEGEEIRQSVELVCAVAGDDPVPQAHDVVRLLRRDGRLPDLLLGATTEPGVPPAADADLLVEIHAERPGWREALARAAEEAGTGGLDVRIVADRPEAVREVVGELAGIQAAGRRILRVGVFAVRTHVTEPEPWRALRDGAAEVGLVARLVGGTRAHFTELNRGHGGLPDDLPALTFSSTPQMHAVETRQVVESIDAQRLTATEALRIAGGRPVHVGPVTLRPRFNAVATVGDVIDPDATDPRQPSPALAAWTVASAAAFARPGVASVAWFEASGPRGVRSADGAPYPVASAVEELRALSGAPAVDAVGAPAGVHVLAGAVRGGVVALVANLGAEAVAVLLRLDGEERSVLVPPSEYRRATWATAGGVGAVPRR